MLELTLALLHSLFSPFILFLSFFIPALRKRRLFEQKNNLAPESESFQKKGLTADLCFEVSSEGELEQIRSYLEDSLSQKKLVELIICSPSVERASLRLFQENSSRLRVLRLPLITFSYLGGQSVKAWMTASTIILCRYDFFPDLTYMAKKKKSILLAATLKNKKKIGYRLKNIYLGFDEIYTSTKADQEKFLTLVGAKKSRFLELRFLSIEKRNLHLEHKLQNNKIMSDYAQFLRQFSGRKLVMGSMWPLEAPLINDAQIKQAIKDQKLHLAVFPHEIDEDAIKLMKLALEKALGDIPVHLVKAGEALPDFLNVPGVALILEKGFLCEFYPFFSDTYVGGGFGRSIHSLLEPYLGECRLFCGPKTQRSTEYELVKENSPEDLFVVQNMFEFGPLFFKEYKSVDRSKRLAMLEWTKKAYQNYFRL
ncbi:MAG: hypothetical protein ACOYL6_08210 [Bacteriovoracaceae bacterium]